MGPKGPTEFWSRKADRPSDRPYRGPVPDIISGLLGEGEGRLPVDVDLVDVDLPWVSSQISVVSIEATETPHCMVVSFMNF